MVMMVVYSCLLCWWWKEKRATSCVGKGNIRAGEMDDVETFFSGINKIIDSARCCNITKFIIGYTRTFILAVWMFCTVVKILLMLMFI